MKKTFWMLGVALAALTSCTQSEVIEVPEKMAIGFDTFVDKTTRAASETEGDLTTTGISNIWVFGDVYSYNSFTSAESRLFDNLNVTKGDNDTWTYDESLTKYWQLNKSYRFAAYSDGGAKLTNVTYNSTKGNDFLEFNNYEAKGKDLVAAIHGDKHTNTGILADPVSFTLSHMLAKVVIEIYVDAQLDNSKVYLSNFKINKAYNKGNCKYSFGSDNTTLNLPVWSYDGISIVEDGAYEDTAGSYLLSTTSQYIVFYVIPNTDFSARIPDLTFNLKSYGINDNNNQYIIHNDNYKLSLDTHVVTNHSRWIPGYSYKYILKYNQGTTDEKPITFSVSEVEAWRAGFGSNTLFTPEKL